MTTKWLLYLISALLIALIYVYLGWATESSPDGSLAASLGLRSKTLNDAFKRDPAVRAWAQTQYGSAEKKGGFALAVLSVIAMLCVLNQSDQAVTIAAAVLFLVEILFFFALRIWCVRKVEARFGASLHEPSSAETADDASPDQEKSSPSDSSDPSHFETDPQQTEPVEAVEAVEIEESTGTLLPAGTDDEMSETESVESETVSEADPENEADADTVFSEEEICPAKRNESKTADSHETAEHTDFAATEAVSPQKEEDSENNSDDSDDADPSDPSDPSDDSSASGGQPSSFPLPPASLRQPERNPQPAAPAQEEEVPAQKISRTAVDRIDSILEETDSAASTEPTASVNAFGLDSNAARALADLQSRLSLSFEQTAEKPHLHRADRHPAAAAPDESEADSAGSFSYRTLAASWNGSSSSR